MAFSHLLTALAVLSGASALQLPLFWTQGQQSPVSSVGKELISSAAIQGDIDADNLLKRAKKLFEIAKLGEDEYNHPTRVIGSKGIFSVFSPSKCKITCSHIV